jgi:hypothetical protein
LCAVDERPGQVGQAAVAGPGAVAEQGEGLVHIHPEALGELALGLFDDHHRVVSSTNVSGSSSASIPLTLLGTADKSGQRG